MRLQKTYAKSVWLSKLKAKVNLVEQGALLSMSLQMWKNGHVVFLLLYDKEDASTVKVNVVKQLVRDMGFDVE